ncbi:hypothetical protein D3C71_1926480 [compost metagenome]
MRPPQRFLRHFGQSDRAYLALAHQCAQCEYDLLYGYGRVAAMAVVEIDLLYAQPAQ